MKPLVYHTEVEDELEESIEFYEDRLPGLGESLFRAYREAVSRIQENPLTGFISEKGTRTCRVSKRFPYGVVFQERDDHILIVAVQDFRRRPGYWTDRLEDMN